MRGGHPLLCAALLFSLAMPMCAFAEGDSAIGNAGENTERNIYIGDVVTLEIATDEYFEAELADKFRDFEIVGMDERAGVFTISLRTFDAGKYSVRIGDKEISIIVSSAFDDIDRDDIFEADARAAESVLPAALLFVFYAAAAAFAIMGGLYLIKKYRKRKAERLSPYDLFLKRVSGLSQDSDGFLVDITFNFKLYIEGLHGRKIIGKTSAEIMGELEEIPGLDFVLPDTSIWLKECDRLKFSGMVADSEAKAGLYEGLLALVKKIEKGDSEVAA